MDERAARAPTPSPPTRGSSTPATSVRDSHFTFQFNRPGTYHYHCTIHPSIAGEIDVRRVILDASADCRRAGRRRRRVRRPHRRPDPPGRHPAQPGRQALRDDRHASTPAPRRQLERPRSTREATGDYRARRAARQRDAAGCWSAIRQRARAARRARASASRSRRALPYAPILVEIYLRERFGWWPLATQRARLRLRGRAAACDGPARVRVVLVDKDGWTPIATSAPVTLRK